MRLVTFTLGNTPPRAGALLAGDRKVLDLQAAYSRVYHGSSPLLASVLAMVETGAEALDVADQLIRSVSDATTHDRGDVKLLAPIPCPPQMRDFLCFEKHLLQAFQAIGKKPPQAWYERPLFYHPSRFSVCGPDAEVPWPSYTERLDFELEFGCYIGRPGKDITKEKARGHIFGYTIFNDFSARDAQRIEMEGRLGPAKGKSFDGGNVMGPWIVTPDEIGDPYKLKMEARVNGKMRSQGVTEGMLFSFEEIIAHVSKDETLMPGEFIGSGTVGNGCGLELGWYLEHGDTIELEVEKIGTLKNRVERQ